MQRRHPVLTAAVLGAAVSCASWTLAQTAPTAPTTSAAAAAVPDGTMTATVDEVSGAVLVRLPGEKDPKPVQKGMTLPEGATILTGLHGACRCSIPPDQMFAVDRLTSVTVAEAVKQGGKVRTDLSMKYGRTQYEIQAAGLEHESTITSPGSTLAVRGTDVALTNSPPFAPRAVSYTGRARFIVGNRTTAFGGAGAGKTAMSASNRDAADAALVASVVDPQYKYSRTASERTVIADQVSRGAILGFDEIAMIPVLRGGTPIRTEAELLPTLPGVLNFVARWTTNSDVNLSVFLVPTSHPEDVGVTIPANPTEFVYPGFGLNHSKSGGTTAFDHRGGPNGGTEIVYFPSAPQGSYGVALTNVSGQTADITLNVFLNGKKQDIIAPDLRPDAPFFLQLTTSYHTVVPVGQSDVPIYLNPDAKFIQNVFTATGFQLTDANNGAPADLPGPQPARLADGSLPRSKATALPASALRNVRATPTIQASLRPSKNR